MADTIGRPRSGGDDRRPAQLMQDILRAWVRGVQATIAFWSGRPGEGLRFVADGLQHAHRGAAARLHAIGARSWAVTPGRGDEAIAALRRAMDARDSVQGHDEMNDGIGGEFAFSAARLALCSGAVYIGLGDGPGAARCAVEALHLLEQTPRTSGAGRCGTAR
jgi:hypothetical protein